MDSDYEKIVNGNRIPAMIKLFNEKCLNQLPYSLQIPSHWHRSLEFSYVRKGEVHLMINNHKKVVKEKEFILVNSSQLHQLSSPYPKECEVVICIISYQFIKTLYPEIDSLYFDIDQSCEKKERLQEIYEYFRIAELIPQNYDYVLTTGYLYEIVYILLKYYQGSVDEKTSLNLKRHKILDYIEDHYSENLSLKRISEAWYMSEGHFSRTFHNYFGINFKTYLTNYCIYCSYHDVAESEKRIEDIAYDHGFPNVKAFINAFKKSYGLTPYQFRKQHQKKTI